MNEIISVISALGIEVIVGILIASVSYVSSIFLGRKISIRKQEDIVRRHSSGQAIIEAQEKFFNQFLSDLPEDSRERYAQYLAVSQRADGSFPEPFFVIGPEGNQADVDLQIDNKFSVLHQRLEVIENRFPQETTIAKIASVNDAIFATRLESITESLKRIDEKMLTKWDVAKIVFQVIASIGGIVSLIFAIIKYILVVGTP